MLDKSIPYKDICMRMPAQTLQALPLPTLPEGFSLAFYEKGRMQDWARIETSVLEFSTEDKALAYFSKEFLPYEEQLFDRMCFILNPEGIAVATATAWRMKSESGIHNSLHWVAATPTVQGAGLGRAVVLSALSRFHALGETKDVYLHTQTWSYKAVMLYHSLGFVMQGMDAYSGKPAPLEDAFEILSWRLPETALYSLRKTAER